MKSDVLFLWDEIDNESLLEKLIIKLGIDKVKYISGSVLWSVDRKNVTKSGKMKLVSQNYTNR